SRRSASRNGNGFSSTVSTTLKIVAVEPMPSVRASSATAVNAGSFANRRAPYRRSCQKKCMACQVSRKRTGRGRTNRNSRGRVQPTVHSFPSLLPSSRPPPFGAGARRSVLGRLDVLFHNPAVEQPYLAVREVRIPRIVRHHTDGGPGGVQLAQQAHHGLPVGRIQVSRGVGGPAGLADRRSGREPLPRAAAGRPKVATGSASSGGSFPPAPGLPGRAVCAPCPACRGKSAAVPRSRTPSDRRSG